MIVGSEDGINTWTLRESHRCEGFLRAAGVADADWQIRFGVGTPQHAKVDALVLAEHSVFTAGGTEFLSVPYASAKAIVIPFLVEDFGIGIATLVDPDVTIESARVQARAKYPDIVLHVAIDQPFIGDEGLYVTRGEAGGFAIFYTERGEKTLLAKTPFAWAAVTFAALELNYGKIEWARFNPPLQEAEEAQP